MSLIFKSSVIIIGDSQATVGRNVRIDPETKFCLYIQKLILTIIIISLSIYSPK